MNEAFAKLFLDTLKFSIEEICTEVLECMDEGTPKSALAMIVEDCQMSFEERKHQLNFLSSKGSSLFEIYRTRRSYKSSSVTNGWCSVAKLVSFFSTVQTLIPHAVGSLDGSMMSSYTM